MKLIPRGQSLFPIALMSLLVGLTFWLQRATELKDNFSDSKLRHDPDYYPRFKAWADDYFLIRHWNEPRGVGGIFYDDLCTGDWEADFAFTRDVGESFLAAFPPLTEQHMRESWTEAEREVQLVKRGRYAEFNLVYDRGTRFGLETGHNPEAVLMSLPPIAKWP